jgi:hypothetical protein
MTMLIHTSAYVVVHEKVAACVREWVEGIRNSVVDPSSPVGRRLARIWESEQGRLPSDITSAPPVSTEMVFRHLGEVLDALEFPVENGASDDRVNYGSGTPRTYIVVGGSILARGLTLEGLTVSYFLRSANQYDTLLQMGRWFGYRANYEDLPRIWMPDALKLRFRDLARVEMEIRQDIHRYHQCNLTPMDVAVRIRSIPGMAITGAAKMRAARTCSISFWGTHRQTFRFHHRDEDELRDNWQAASDLLREADRMGRRAQRTKGALWRDVPRSAVVEFLRRYRFFPDHDDLKPAILLPFVGQTDSRLARWNVGVVFGTGDAVNKALGPLDKVMTVRRARLKNEAKTSYADIKALMSKADVWFDCDDDPPSGATWDELKERRRAVLEEERPLLLLYPIEMRSEPRVQRARDGLREPLDAVDHVMGVGIVFPGSVTEGAAFVSVELHPLSADEIEEIEAEEAAQVEAAGV